jgi:signal transduction histidine kinase/CheY-like chemotaxis protein
MNIPLPFFNVSLKKVLMQEPDTLRQARIKIVFSVLLFSLLKIAIITPLSFHDLPLNQLYRIAFLCCLYTLLIKYLLYKPLNINTISHIILITGVAGIWSNVFIFGQQLNVITIQFVLMVTFVSFYLTHTGYAFFYSAFSISPVVFYLLSKNNLILHLQNTSQQLPSPAYEIIVILNFATVVLVHYLYYSAFKKTVNEKETLNKQLQATLAETKALAESRSVFLSTMSHELRTPLNAVIGMTNLIKDTATKDQNENLDILEFSAISLLTLVNDILDYNKGENDKIELELIPVNLAELLHKICAGLQYKAIDKGFELALQVDDKLKDQWVITDPTRLTQILYNLAGNAIKFTDQGQVCVKAAIAAEEPGQLLVHFSVSDTGIGIPLSRQDAIFEPFEQANADTTRRYGGTGLGLAIVKRLLKLFGSTIELKSKPDEGSVFSFSIPFKLYIGSIKPILLPASINSSLANLNILIAEDNPINVLLLVRLLTKWNVNAVVAINGSEAVSKMLSHEFDVVLMDLHMPIMDGFEATTAIRNMDDQIKAHVPIIALTASVSHNIFEKVREAGMYDFLSKPFQPAALFEKLELLSAAKTNLNKVS